MVNNTVNGKKIGIPAGIGDSIKVTYCGFGKEHEKGITVGRSDSNPLIESIKESGDKIKETSTYVAIKAYPGGRETSRESLKDGEITH